MPKYRCTITREVTESAHVIVEARDLKQANLHASLIALDPLDAEYPKEWTPDDNEPGVAYVPDMEYAEKIE